SNFSVSENFWKVYEGQGGFDPFSKLVKIPSYLLVREIGGKSHSVIISPIEAERFRLQCSDSPIAGISLYSSSGGLLCGERQSEKTHETAMAWLALYRGDVRALDVMGEKSRSQVLVRNSAPGLAGQGTESKGTGWHSQCCFDWLHRWQVFRNGGKAPDKAERNELQSLFTSTDAVDAQLAVVEEHLRSYLTFDAPVSHAELPQTAKPLQPTKIASKSNPKLGLAPGLPPPLSDAPERKPGPNLISKPEPESNPEPIPPSNSGEKKGGNAGPPIGDNPHGDDSIIKNDGGTLVEVDSSLPKENPDDPPTDATPIKETSTVPLAAKIAMGIGIGLLVAAAIVASVFAGPIIAAIGGLIALLFLPGLLTTGGGIIYWQLNKKKVDEAID
ncbi:MAG: hypothetical protein LBS68_03590, partial [Puniceicoccales bacterium]|nr:hypothetical protein [Puniceicoccales bacterium]